MNFLYVIPILTFAFIVVNGIFKIADAKTETQQYETIYKDGSFEIRYHPQAILATVKMGGTYDDSRNSGFRILAGYIFGGNKENEKIAMTSPVRMSNIEKVNTMSFVLPSKMEFNNNVEYLGNNAPYDMINHRNEVLVELPDFNPQNFQTLTANQ